ncbi:MAG: efflux RND transporter periplasmic adaptor subunit [Porticoccaceae bacterium]|nr:efflux RND transporter periplasmic adaptor subunit [Porticoccaceae bacterium]
MKEKLKPVAIVALFVFIAAAMTALRPAPVKISTPENAIAVKTQKIKSTQARLAVESQGSVLPRTRTSLISEVSGAVLEVSPQFIVGGRFEQGDTLLRLDPTDYEVALQRAEARLISRNAQLTFEQARATQAKKEWAMTGRPATEAPILALREPYLAEARANVLQAEAEVKQAQQKLRRTTIRAPYTGIVSAKSVDVGQYVTVGTPLGKTFAIDFVEVRLPLTDKDLSMMADIGFFSAATAPTVVLSATVGGEQVDWTGTLVRSEGVVNELNRSQYVVVQVVDPYGIGANPSSPPLLVGTFVRAALAGKQLDNVFKVPRHAMLEGSKVALVDAQSRLRLTPVESQFGNEDFYFVSAGMTDGDELIVSALGIPIDGMKVNPQKNISDGGE